MNSVEIASVLKGSIDKKKCNFLGVYPKDQVPQKITKFPACLIANTDPSYKPGQHWIALFYKGAKDCEFFDSYGLHPASYGFNFSHCSLVNKKSLQSLASSSCGHFCIYFLVFRSRGIRPKSILDSFCPSNPKCNDSKVINFVKNLKSRKVTGLSLSHQCCTSQSCARNCLHFNVCKNNKK